MRLSQGAMPASSEDESRTGEDGSAGIVARSRAINQNPKLVEGVRRLRRLLPGDKRFGDPLSTSGNVVGQRIGELATERPSILGEAGLGALQVWQALSENAGRGRGERDLAIVFTDLVDFSNWSMQAGDDATLALLRDVAEAIEPPMREHGGEIVKRLGDGMMAVFAEPADALGAVNEACERLGGVQADGYHPQVRAGIHVGRPRRIGGDYLGVDVNIAARVAEQAAGNEVLVSDRALEALDDGALGAKRKRLFRAKGVPDEIGVYSVKRR
jgi:adenylate cyclase